MKLPRWWPGLCTDRADVLAALALVSRQWEPLDRGLARLAAGDPLLQTWSDRLGPDLAGGMALGQVLVRHRLATAEQGRAMDQAADIPAEIERLTVEAAEPIPGLWLIRWFPVALVVSVLAPLGLLVITGIAQQFRSIYGELGISLPHVTLLLLDDPWVLLLELVKMVVGVALLLKLVESLRVIRHVPQLWWPSVHREMAIRTLLLAAQAGANAPRHLRFPLNWLAALRISFLRQDKPRWDPALRTFRILTRWRALSPSWKHAAQSPTAVGVLQALGFLADSATSDHIRQRLDESRERLRRLSAVALAQVRGAMTVGFGLGIVVAIMALIMPLVKIVDQLGSGGAGSGGSGPGATGLVVYGVITFFMWICLLIPQVVMATVRLLLGLRLPGEYGLVFHRLAEATRYQQPWPEVLMGLRLLLPWPWPYRLRRAAEQLSSGTAPENVLAESSLLPRSLRAQAAQALRQGPATFIAWCESLDATSQRQSRWSQNALIMGIEFLVSLLIIHFMMGAIFPKFLMIYSELGVQATLSQVQFLREMTTWEAPILGGLALVLIFGALFVHHLCWRNARRLQAGHLILRGTEAGVPEAALGTGDGFTAICQTAGWLATTPRELARAVRRAEWNLARRAAWLPAVVAALFPVVLAIPVGAMVIGIMRLLILLVYQVGDTP